MKRYNKSIFVAAVVGFGCGGMLQSCGGDRPLGGIVDNGIAPRDEEEDPDSKDSKSPMNTNPGAVTPDESGNETGQQYSVLDGNISITLSTVWKHAHTYSTESEISTFDRFDHKTSKRFFELRLAEESDICADDVKGVAALQNGKLTTCNSGLAFLQLTKKDQIIAIKHNLKDKDLVSIAGSVY